MSGGENDSCIGVWVACVYTRALTNLLPAFRSRSLYVPPDLGLLRFGDALEEGGVALHPKEKLLLHLSPTKT